MIVSTTVHERRAYASFKPRYLPTIQKPLSITWERMVAPEAIKGGGLRYHGGSPILSLLRRDRLFFFRASSA